MKLPSMKYGDGIKKTEQVKFGGLNRSEGAQDGEIRDMENMTGDHYPVLATRRKRWISQTLGEPGGLFCWEGLCWVDGEKFFYKGAEKGTLSKGKKVFSSLGPYIVILPDKCFYNVDTDTFGKMEARWTGERLTFTNGLLYEEEAQANTISCQGVSWADWFHVGDAVTIRGCTRHPENNKSIIIRAMDGEKLYFYEFSFTLEEGAEYEETGELTIERTVPELKGYIAAGKSENEAFALAFGDQALEMGLDFLGGFISGGFMSGGNAAINMNFTRKLGQELGQLNLSEEDVKAFIETGLDSDPETASYQIAQELQKKMDAGKKLSNYDLSRLYQANILSIEEENKGNTQPGDRAAGNERGAQNGAESNGQLEGLSLPTLEEDARTNQNDQVEGQQGAQRNAPISVEERLRQGKKQNGGIQNVRTSEQGQQLTAGAGILDGGQERNAGTGAAEQDGGLETGAIQQSSTTVDQRRAIVARQNLARHLRLEKTSSQELGLQNGTEAKTIQVMPQEQWDGEMKTLAERLYNETGKNVAYVMGRIQIRGAGGNVGYVRGVFSGDRIVLQADNLRVPMEKIADHEAYHAKVDFAGKAGLNQEIKRHIINTFSKEQFKKVAPQEINKVSNVLYGYDKAMGKNYAPIYTNKNYTKAEFGVFDQTAEGVGNLKGRIKSKNPSYNISAFDAFERHVDQTARFCAMAIPARNWTTFMNWREKNNSAGDVITHKWGEEGKKYITDLITNLQSGDSADENTLSRGVEKLMSNYIAATFGTNPSIVLKQLGSIPLATVYLDAKNIPSLTQLRNIDRKLIAKYTQDLEWRTMGYSMPETKFLKENPNWAQSNKVFGFFIGGDAITAMDGWAASTLWPWAENKVRREYPDLEIGTQEQVENGESPFYRKVAEEFENAVARSQSTSDEIHQGILRKSKNPITRAFTMFRSDSAQTYNAIRQMIGEAQYYKRTGKDPGKLRAAKRKVGTAIVTAIAGYLWAEAVEFLMNLWKHKGKKYRDEDGELTAESVMGEMVYGLIGDMAGIVVGGEELFDFVGGVILDDTWFGINTMGMEQLNDMLETAFEAAGSMRDIIADGVDIVKNGGDLWEYFRRHGNDMLGSIKNVAKAVAVYIPGMPANNLEAYLLGPLKWISPKLQTAYEDLMQTADKNGLSGLEGDALTGRIGSILDNRRISQSEGTAQILAELYEAGYTNAVPGDTPESISVNGEERKLGAYQQQTYDAIWGSVVADALDEMVASDAFTSADQKTQAKMLANLYQFASERTKAELFDDYELSEAVMKNVEIITAGASTAQLITWNAVTSEMKGWEKAAELASWNMPDKAKRAVFRNKISESREDVIEEFWKVGLSLNQFLRAYSKYGEINSMDLKASEKAVEFSRWVNGQGYNATQSAVIRDQLSFFAMTPVTAGKYDKLVEAGLDEEDAYKLMVAMNALEPEEGKISVSDIQRWRVCVDFTDDANDQLTALSAVMDDKQFVKVEIAYSFGVSPESYIRLQEIKSGFDKDGNEYLSVNEIKAAINSMSGLTVKQRAVLWQLATGSKSARKNPYDAKVGQQVIEAKEKAKANSSSGAGAKAAGEDDSFQQAFLNQLLGIG